MTFLRRPEDVLKTSVFAGLLLDIDIGQYVYCNSLLTRFVKNISFFYLETLKNVILNKKFYPQITTIRAFFLQIRTLFSNF